MARDHFAQYRNQKPAEYKAFSDAMWNGFVSITHKVGLNRFFSFTPDFLADVIDYDDQDAGLAVGEALGEIYAFSNGIPVELFDQEKPL